jgi:hypothetical protein
MWQRNCHFATLVLPLRKVTHMIKPASLLGRVLASFLVPAAAVLLGDFLVGWGVKHLVIHVFITLW